ncbi:MAG: winged helix-turn-helix domain-containing protein [Chloroflexota bacterium]
MSDSHIEIKEEQWLTDVETIKVFADTLRLDIIEFMKTPKTVKEISAHTNIPASKLYYHINLLHKHDLIQVVRHNIEGNLVEKVYQVTAHQFKLVNPLLSGKVPDESATALFTSMLQATQRDFVQAYTNRDETEGTPPRHPFFSKKSFRLTETQLTALHTKLDALIQEVTDYGLTNDDVTDPLYELTLVFYRQYSEGESK